MVKHTQTIHRLLSANSLKVYIILTKGNKMQHFVEDSAAYIANFGFINLALLFIELLDYANLTQKKM